MVAEVAATAWPCTRSDAASGRYASDRRRAMSPSGVRTRSRDRIGGVLPDTQVLSLTRAARCTRADT
jgi:hypothetical protein